MFLSLDGTFWVQLINFAIFFAILNAVFLRPVQKAIAARREYIDGLTADYDRAQERASALRREAEEIHAQARRESDAILAQSRADAGNIGADIVAEYGAKAQAAIEAAHAEVAKEIEAIRPKQDALANALAETIVGKVLPERVTP